MEKLLKVLTDPVSNCILQMIRVRGKMTISEILAEKKQFPRATVYRRMDKMLEVGAIEIVDFNRVRGQIENVYAIKEMYITDPKSDEECMKIVNISLMQILGLYERYFKSGDADVNRDRLFLQNYAIALSDSDFAEMLKEVFSIIDKYQKMESSEDAKLRNLFLLSAPKGDI
ncbi:MAG: helix-turn-helix domain-containing protein [Oscillospiraceae bacterium]|nr:helix-turn-helix domain-containing protein [Oscillospiraceae bacterium]